MIKNKVNLEKPGWNEYQARLKRSPVKKRFTANTLKLTSSFVIFLAVFFGIINGLGGKSYFHVLTELGLSNENKSDARDTSNTLIDKKDVQAWLDRSSFLNLKDQSFDFTANGLKFRVKTSLDIPLQHFLLKKLNMSTSRYIGIVAMDPATGRILSMVGYDKTNRSGNPCVDNKFPAASIFKIVTASAAIETCGLHLGSKLTYNGNKHTLYKSQLKDRINRYTHQITFEDSFAQSVNPVFGKIGAYYLGKSTLENYAAAFGFNQSIDFEIQLAPSMVSFSNDPYQWAEVASGFNLETKISPLHGAVITSAILNQGRMVEPTIVDQITDENGRILYRSQLIILNQAITPAASNIVNALMETTINSGTCKKAFRGLKKDKILSRLNIGGKSGSIDNQSHDARYDWFVGFAEEKEGSAKIVLSAVVAHEKYIGIRASEYARMAIKQYFSNYFTNN
ncbi:MAG: PbpA [Desulfobacterales bacterium]|uniref:PbpA n=1 Tax=Candidatus Desulfatibia profunda TaxID=2841695 RepID=A0A8J6NN34_9BACT|nr:PbpA [Candidatus Desulfatibia profunda]MBL7179857.1 PbpA [Desulfobacterales bacterium]